MMNKVSDGGSVNKLIVLGAELETTEIVSRRWTEWVKSIRPLSRLAPFPRATPNPFLSIVTPSSRF
ncbi:hypothetical protein NITHO_480002 [Nitrolancea hollandica Lb]|uniref:Uncharacterized protein n=1 Tax=Nitrolancea hollandica Lb TaxID=1129897 RepID=I4EKU2_9BACT|nr:hypothetical protein NITHO_480002 [Nitrolancea hollandica Lb]